MGHLCSISLVEVNQYIFDWTFWSIGVLLCYIMVWCVLDEVNGRSHSFMQLD